MEDLRECNFCRKLRSYPSMFVRGMDVEAKEYKTCNVCSEKLCLRYRKRKMASETDSAAERNLTFATNIGPPAKTGRCSTQLLIMAALQQFRCPICRLYISYYCVCGQSFDAEQPQKKIPVCDNCLVHCDDLTAQERLCLRELFRVWSEVFSVGSITIFDEITAQIPARIEPPTVAR